MKYPNQDKNTENRKQNNFGKAVQNFWYYYKRRTLWVVLAVLVIAFLIVSTALQKESLLNGLVINAVSADLEKQLDVVTNDFLNQNEMDTSVVTVDIKSGLSFIADDTDFSEENYQTIQILTTYIGSGVLDFVLSDLESASTLAYSDFFVDLSTILTEEQYAAYEPYFLYVDWAVIEQLEEMANNGDYSVEIVIPDCHMPQIMEKPIPIFIDLTKCDDLDSIIPNWNGDVVLAVAYNAPHPDTLLSFIDYLVE